MIEIALFFVVKEEEKKKGKEDNEIVFKSAKNPGEEARRNGRF